MSKNKPQRTEQAGSLLGGPMVYVYDPNYEFDAPKFRDFENPESDGRADCWFDYQHPEDIELEIPIEFPNLCPDLVDTSASPILEIGSDRKPSKSKKTRTSRHSLRPSSRQQQRKNGEEDVDTCPRRRIASALSIASPNVGTLPTAEMTSTATPSARPPVSNPECLLSALKSANSRRDTVLARRTHIQSACKPTPAVTRLMFSPAAEHVQLPKLPQPVHAATPIAEGGTSAKQNASPVVSEGSPALATIARYIRFDDDDSQRASSSPALHHIQPCILECVLEEDKADSTPSPTSREENGADKENADAGKKASSRMFKPTVPAKGEGETSARGDEKNAVLVKSRRVVKSKNQDSKVAVLECSKQLGRDLVTAFVNERKETTATHEAGSSLNTQQVVRRVVKAKNADPSDPTSIIIKVTNSTSDAETEERSKVNAKSAILRPKSAVAAARKPAQVSMVKSAPDTKKVMSNAPTAVPRIHSQSKAPLHDKPKVALVRPATADARTSQMSQPQRGAVEPKKLDETTYQRLLMRSRRSPTTSMAAAEPSHSQTAGAEAKRIAKTAVGRAVKPRKSKSPRRKTTTRVVKTEPRESESKAAVDASQHQSTDTTTHDVAEASTESSATNSYLPRISVDTNRARRMSRRAWHELETEVEATEEIEAALQRQLLAEMIQVENAEPETDSNTVKNVSEAAPRSDEQDIVETVDEGVEQRHTARSGSRPQLRSGRSITPAPSEADSSHRHSKQLTSLEAQLAEIARRREELKKILERNRRALKILGMHEPPATSLEVLAAPRTARSVSRDRRLSADVQALNTSITSNTARRSSSTSRSRQSQNPATPTTSSISIALDSTNGPADQAQSNRSNSIPRLTPTQVRPPVLHTALRAEYWAQRHRNEDDHSQPRSEQEYTFKAQPVDPKVLAGVEKMKLEKALMEKHNSFKPTDPKSPAFSVRTRRSILSVEGAEHASTDKKPVPAEHERSQRALKFKNRTDGVLAAAAELTTRCKVSGATPAGIQSVSALSMHQTKMCEAFETKQSIAPMEADSETAALLDGLDKITFSGASSASEPAAQQKRGVPEVAPAVTNNSDEPAPVPVQSQTKRVALRPLSANVVAAKASEVVNRTKPISRNLTATSKPPKAQPPAEVTAGTHQFKARPVPKTAPFVVKRSSRPPTIPITPKLLTRSSTASRIQQ